MSNAVADSWRRWVSDRDATDALLALGSLVVLFTVERSAPDTATRGRAAAVLALCAGVALVVSRVDRFRDAFLVARRRAIPGQWHVPLAVPLAVVVGAMFAPVDSVAKFAVEYVVWETVVLIAAFVGVQVVRSVGVSRERRRRFAVEAVGASLFVGAVDGGTAVTVFCSLVLLPGYEVSYDVGSNVFRFDDCYTQPNRWLLGVGAAYLLAAWIGVVPFGERGGS